MRGKCSFAVPGKMKEVGDLAERVSRGEERVKKQRKRGKKKLIPVRVG